MTVCSLAECLNSFKPYRSTQKYCCRAHTKLALNREERIRHPERCRAYGAKYRNGHQARVSAMRAAYWETHRHTLRTKNKEYYVRLGRTVLNERYRLWYQTHPGAARMYSAKRVSHIQLTPSQDRLTTQEWRLLVRAYGNCCAYCHKPCVPTVDHIVPLSKGGEHTLDNALPACVSCNASKGDKDVGDYLASIGWSPLG